MQDMHRLDLKKTKNKKNYQEKNDLLAFQKNRE